MEVWAGFWNILSGKQFLLGDSVNEETARRYAAEYQKKYPNMEFSVVQVDFSHPRWFQEEDYNNRDQTNDRGERIWEPAE